VTSRCHLCDVGDLTEVPGLEGLRGVTSDCRPWPHAGDLRVCVACGGVQKAIDADWHEEMERLYAGYAIYHQADGAEQSVFGEQGQSQARSSRLLDGLVEHVDLPASGRLLDIGCGNGALLRGASSRLAGWRLSGTELSRDHWESMTDIPGIEELYTAAPAEVPGTFDLVTMVHVLEHIVAPTTWLTQVRDKLTEEGRLLVEVPDYRQNPFDLLIADHATHFSEETVTAVLAAAGLPVQLATTEWVAKELSVVADRAGPAPVLEGDAGTAVDRAAACVSWLLRVRDVAAAARSSEPFGVFGTSIAATWLAGELGDAVDFFVDEDANRQGRDYLGRPVLSPGDVAAQARVFLALAPRVAAPVRYRLAATHAFDCVPPPELTER
jgi:trans-aconitate methyltransferase